MSRYAIWIDRELAKVIEFSDPHQDPQNLVVEGCRTESRQNSPHQSLLADQDYFIRLAGMLDNASQILILGPGVAKHHFQTYLCEQNPMLAKRIVSCEAMERQSDSKMNQQMSALAAKYFSRRS